MHQGAKSGIDTKDVEPIIAILSAYAKSMIDDTYNGKAAKNTSSDPNPFAGDN